MMPSPLTIKKYIAKTKAQLVKQRKKMEYSKHTHHKIKAKDEIERLESKLLYFQQLEIYEQAKHERDKKANRAKQQHDDIQELQRCDQVGAGADTAGGECPW